MLSQTFSIFWLFVDHKDMNFGSANLMDDVVIGCSPSAVSPKAATHHAGSTNAGSSSAPAR
jgi:hypothetical protein